MNGIPPSQPVHLDFFLKRLLIFDGFLLFSPLWQRSCGMLLILATFGASWTGLLSFPAEEHDVWRGLGTGMPLESWFMLQDFSKMPLYTLLAGLKIDLLCSMHYALVHSFKPLLELSLVICALNLYEFNCTSLWGEKGNRKIT